MTHRLWQAVDEHGTVLDTLIQMQRNTVAARTVFTRLLGEDETLEVMPTDNVWS